MRIDLGVEYLWSFVMVYERQFCLALKLVVDHGTYLDIGDKPCATLPVGRLIV